MSITGLGRVGLSERRHRLQRASTTYRVRAPRPLALGSEDWQRGLTKVGMTNIDWDGMKERSEDQPNVKHYSSPNRFQQMVLGQRLARILASH